MSMFVAQLLKEICLSANYSFSDCIIALSVCMSVYMSVCMSVFV